MTDINSNSIIYNPNNTTNSNVVIDNTNLVSPLQISTPTNIKPIPVKYTNGIITNNKTTISQLLQFLTYSSISLSQYKVGELLKSFQDNPTIPQLTSVFKTVKSVPTVFIDPIYKCKIIPSDITPYIGQQSPISNPMIIPITLPGEVSSTIKVISIMQNGNQLSIIDTDGKIITLFLEVL